MAFLGSLVLDFLTKTWVRTTIALGESKPIIPGFLQLTHWLNPGAAFGFFQGKNVHLAVISAVSVAASVAVYPRFKAYGWLFSVSLGLVSGGALGNLIDRVRFQSVTDFVSFSFFKPIFNIADSAIVVGGIMMVVFFIFFGKESI